MDKSDKESISSADTDKQGESKRAKKLDLSVAQVLGSAVAAVVAAFAAGQLGVYGTFLGAGVMSLVATSGGPIFQHFFSRTGEQLKEVTVPPKARQAPVRDPAAGWKDDEGHHTSQAVHNADALHDPRAAATQLLPTTSWGRGPGSGTAGDSGGTTRAAGAVGGATTGGAAAGGAAVGDDEARALSRDDITRALRPDAAPRAPGGTDATQALRSEDATRMLRRDDPTRALRRDEATQVLGTVKRPVGPVGAEELPGHGEFTGATTHGTKWRGWRRTLLPAVVVFVIAIGGVTLYEAISGHSVSGGKGTSISDVFRPSHGSSTGDSPDAPPASTDPDGTGNGESPTPDPQESGHSTDPSDNSSGEEGRTGTGETGEETSPTPDPSRSQSDGTEGSGNSDSGDSSTDDSSGEGSRQDGGGAAGSGETGGAGSGAQLPQGQQPGASSQG
ncbi:hypothetical protein [Streptomyces sp. RK75]|uniref:hypothetical protein n=1 Tax=Streptomyces sp. RK75 TaxID=2824895 RepID=UPI001B38562A|nr:hypothetical protein [Streptomyces sp. RK75]MBQ0864225.1 hypothetical protein [Streptomyces sp. RK75]